MEAVRHGQLFPQRPYTIRVNTFHIPSVESTLLHLFAKGAIFTQIAPLVFRDTLRDTVRYMRLGVHLAEHKTVGECFTRLSTISWTLRQDYIMWRPRHYARFAHCAATDFSVLLALAWRVNGASDMHATMRGTKRISAAAAKSDVVGAKVRAFMDRHLEMAMFIDQMNEDDLPSDKRLSELDKCQVPSGGPTDYTEDRDSITCTTQVRALAETPLEVLRHSGVLDEYELEEFECDTRTSLGRIALRIRTEYTDADLTRLFLGGDESEAFDYYYPMRPETPADCRSHSWYLACLVMINKAWGEVQAQGKHDNRVVYAFYRIMGSFVPLMHRIISNGEPFSDEAWRPKPDDKPSAFDMYFPADTVCFHAGDLPRLEAVLDQVGIYGVQVVKNEIPLVRMVMKSLPVCCQGRDLTVSLDKEVRAVNGDGFWRVVRLIFFVSLCGLYPHATRRIDFRSMMRIYDMLFYHKDMFLTALAREQVDLNKEKKVRAAAGLTEKKKKQSASKTSQLIEAAFREFFIHSMSDNHEWVAVVNHRIRWSDFVTNTFRMADEMRRWSRFAAAPPGNEFLHAINALWDCKSEYGSDVYRYRKKEYAPTIMEVINDTQDALNEKRRLEVHEIALVERLTGALVEQGFIDEDELEPLLRSRHRRGVFKGDPAALYREGQDAFGVALRTALADSHRRYTDLTYRVPPDVRSNIINFLLRTPSEDHLRFDWLLDPRLGGVSREAVQTLNKTRHIYLTRSSPKSITTHIENLRIRDLRVFSWYFNVMSRLERFKLVPLDAETQSNIAHAFRDHRFRLLDDEPIPPNAYIVYICICCKRVATFSDSPLYGNFGISYDPETRNMVCSKKVTRAARARNKTVDTAASVLDNETERVRREETIRHKKARTERKDDNSLQCEGQPAIPIDLRGAALEFDGERYMFCPRCGQFHTYRELGWGRQGYACTACRAKETPAKKLQRCAFCHGGGDRGPDLKMVEVIVLDKDPANPDHKPLLDPLACYQTLYFCQPHANSAGLYAPHSSGRYYNFMPKDRLFELISPATSARAIAYLQKYHQ